MGRLFWEIVERTTKGPLMKEEEFETEFFPKKMGEIVKSHNIEYDPEEPVMTDPNMADEIFEAGIELLVEVGLYCKNTRRIVKFEESEIKEVIATRKREVVLGWGRDRIKMKLRKPGDRRHPYTFLPAGWITSDISLFRDSALTAAIEPTADGLIPLILEGIGEIKPTTGTPTEILLVQTEARIMREVAARAGRPGIWFGLPMNASSPVALMNAFGPGLYNRYNANMPVHILQDMRIDYDRLNLAYFAMQHGIKPWISSCPTMYAYIRGPEEAAVEAIAHTLGMMAFSDGSLTQAMTATIENRYDGRDVFWANSAIALAIERNLKVPMFSFGGGIPTAPQTEVSYYAVACHAIIANISGMEGTWLTGGYPGLDGRWGGEITRAVAGISVEEGVRLVKDLLKKYEDKVPQIPIEGKSLYELYDMKTLKPKKDYFELYLKMVNEFKDLGFDYPTWS